MMPDSTAQGFNKVSSYEIEIDKQRPNNYYLCLASDHHTDRTFSRMDILEFREFCLTFPGSEECMPFDERTLVFKVGGRMFTLADTIDFAWINLKCDPDRAIILRERYPEVIPGRHMNKRHWNSVRVTGDLPDSLLRTWIRDSYDLVVSGLPRRIRETLDVQ